MALRVVFTELPRRHMEEPGLPPLVAGWDFFDDLSPGLRGERKESPLPKQSKGPICLEEPLGG